MSIDEIEAEALKLTPQARAKLAGRLLESLEGLSEEENQRLWVDEVQRRDADLDGSPDKARPADDVFREARSKLK
jgi:putative addiction module component (TIGR02574 family)